jgi:hypothetical protein
MAEEEDILLLSFIIMAMKGSELTDTDSPYTLLHMIPTAKLQQLRDTSLSLCLSVFHMFLSQQEQQKEQ